MSGLTELRPSWRHLIHWSEKQSKINNIYGSNRLCISLEKVLEVAALHHKSFVRILEKLFDWYQRSVPSGTLQNRRERGGRTTIIQHAPPGLKICGMKQEVDNPIFIRFFFTFCACKTYKLRQKPVLYATRHYQVLKRAVELKVGMYTWQVHLSRKHCTMLRKKVSLKIIYKNYQRSLLNSSSATQVTT